MVEEKIKDIPAGLRTVGMVEENMKDAPANLLPDISEPIAREPATPVVELAESSPTAGTNGPAPMPAAADHWQRLHDFVQVQEDAGGPRKLPTASLLPNVAEGAARASSTPETTEQLDNNSAQQPAATTGTPDHLQRLRDLIQVQANAARPTSRRQRTAAQQPRRRLEQDVRQRAVDFYRQMADTGATLADAAQQLWLLPRTLRQWDSAGRPERAPAPLGRPPRDASADQRTAVLDFLHSHGPGVSVPRLRHEFPSLARAELDDILHRHRHEQRDTLRVLHWQVPGRVWAIDFAEPSLLGATSSLPPIDGRYPYLLAVRDLASGYQLAWLPLALATAAVTQALLQRLFAEHGAPLVLKSDNGPPFRADDSKTFLDRAGVFPLFSPPACPAYNGSIEAAIRSLKKRTHDQAARRGQPEIWTSADLEAALRQANAGHPLRLNGRTPAAVWSQRSPIGIVERLRFAVAVEHQREQARQELGIDPAGELEHWTQGKVDRPALERALVERDYLLFTRRRLPLSISGGKVTSNG
jgi:transposase InsO family protein